MDVVEVAPLRIILTTTVQLGSLEEWLLHQMSTSWDRVTMGAPEGVTDAQAVQITPMRSNSLQTTTSLKATTNLLTQEPP